MQIALFGLKFNQNSADHRSQICYSMLAHVAPLFWFCENWKLVCMLFSRQQVGAFAQTRQIGFCRESRKIGKVYFVIKLFGQNNKNGSKRGTMVQNKNNDMLIIGYNQNSN